MSFAYIVKRQTQTGRMDNNTTFSPSSKTYRKAILSCTFGSMNKPPQFFSYPLMAFYFLHKLK
jgi:hypothetical protein